MFSNNIWLNKMHSWTNSNVPSTDHILTRCNSYSQCLILSNYFFIYNNEHGIHNIVIKMFQSFIHVYSNNNISLLFTSSLQISLSLHTAIYFCLLTTLIKQSRFMNWVKCPTHRSYYHMQFSHPTFNIIQLFLFATWYL